MKFLVILALCLAVASAARLPQRDLVVPPVDNRITNGQNAKVGQFPYQVGLSLQLGRFSAAWCGGSLIGENWVLTAAHCTEGVQSVTVYLGSNVRTVAQQSFTVTNKDIIINSGWNSKTLKNDISLIKIPSVSFTKLIAPVKLPAIAKTYSNLNGESAIASGWGRTSDTSSTATDLQWARLQIVSNAVCSSTYGTFAVSSSNVCVATVDSVSTCQGDSGGPLVLESTQEQVGLTSYGAKDGCELNFPIAFTRITSYLDWIKTNTGISY